MPPDSKRDANHQQYAEKASLEALSVYHTETHNEITVAKLMESFMSLIHPSFNDLLSKSFTNERSIFKSL